MIVRILISAVVGILFSLFAFTKSFSAAEGPLFDTLAAKRPGLVPSREILLLEVDKESAAEVGNLPWDSEFISEGLRILAEMSAGTVVLDSALEKKNFLYAGMNDELQDYFNSEFALIKNNVKTLFEAIRLGSVRPKDSAAFVDDILSLTDKSKLRLMEATGSREPDKIISERVYHSEIPVESDLHFIRPTFARFGLTERADPLGYAVLQAVLSRLGNPSVETALENIVFHKAFLTAKNESDIVIPLDKRGAVLLELPKGTSESSFRRLSYSFLIRHSRLEADLINELKVMEQAGYLSWSGEAMSPVAVYEVTKKPGGLDAEEWRALRRRFFKITAGLLYGNAEKKIDAGYAAMLESPTLTPEGRRNLLGLKSAAADSFSHARKNLTGLLKVRKKLEKEIQSSLCIIVPELQYPESRVQAAAGLADVVLSGHFFSIFPSFEAFLVSGFVALLVSLLLAAFTPGTAALVGGAAALLSAFATSLFFIYSGIWFNPLLAAGSAAVSAFVSVLTGLLIRIIQNSAMYKEFYSSVSWESIESQQPVLQPAAEQKLLEGEKREASIIAVRLNMMALLPDLSAGDKIASAFHVYHETIGAVLKKQGGFLYALEGEVIFASFEEPIQGKNHRMQAELAASAVIDSEYLLAHAFSFEGIAYQNGSISVGIDAGFCDFGRRGITGLPGYFPSGSVPARSSMLSGLGDRYNCRILITGDVAEEICDGFEAVKLDKLIPEIDKSGKYFFELRRLG